MLLRQLSPSNTKLMKNLQRQCGFLDKPVYIGIFGVGGHNDMKFKEEEVKEIREMINAVDSHNAYNDDMIEYSTVQPIYSGLKFDVYVDTGLAYIHNNHEPVVFVRDGSEKKNPLIPITVSLSPKVVGGVVPKNLKQEDVDSIFRFIVQNYEALILLAEDKLSITKFIDGITRVHKIVAESIEEMAK